VTEKSDTAFRTISEAADEIGVPAHVLRFWETRFSMLQPLKRAGGRRYYRPVDMSLLRQIKALLHDDEFKTRYKRIADTIAFISPPPGALCAYIRKPLLFHSPAATSACNFLASIIT
jgi:hypothetical protein